MRVLYLAPAPPAPTTGGGSLRMFHMVRYLGARVELDLLAPAGAGAEEAERLCKPFCHDLEFVPPSPAPWPRRSLRLGPYETNPALLAAVSRRLSSGPYGAIQVEKPAMLPYVPRRATVPVVLDIWAYGLLGPLRALRHQRGFLPRLRTLVQLGRFACFDAFSWPSTACLLLVSEIDRRRCARRRPHRRTLVVPNGVDCHAFRPPGIRPAGAPVVLFSGDMSFAPNVDAAVLLATRIFPAIRRRHPTAELRLAGRHPGAAVRRLDGPGVTVTGEVADMTDELHRATVYLAPHFTGAGTRTKILEAMASGLPIVTTTTGLEGIEARPGREVLVADDVQGLATSAITLLEDEQRRAELGDAARRLAEERFDWAHCLAPLGRLYEELASTRGGAC